MGKFFAQRLGLIILSTQISAVHASHALEIQLREQVQVIGRYYTLGELAQVQGNDLKLVQRAERIRIGRTPRVGSNGQLTRETIVNRVERAIPMLTNNVLWKGAQLSLVQSAAVKYERQKYIGSAQRFLSGWLAQHVDDYAIRATGIHKDIELPPGAVRLIPSIGPKQKISKRMCVWLDVQVNDKHYRTLQVWFEVSAMSTVIEAIRELPAGAAVHPGSVRHAVADIAKVSGSPLQGLEELTGQRLTRKLSRGEVITSELLEPLPLVNKGQKVQVQASVGNVSLTVQGRALEDGYRGDRIRLERLDGHDRYAAVVIDNGLVSVDGD